MLALQKMFLFIAFAIFCGENITTMTDLKLPTDVTKHRVGKRFA
jgi:hypothetical protein